MIVAGVDVGAATGKTLILKVGNGVPEILAYSICQTGPSVKRAAIEVTGEALEKAGVSMDDLEYVIGTGYGRNAIDFADRALTEILCHAKGAHFLIPNTKAIIDIGGQDSKAIGVNEDGTVDDFVMNDKCAAGTGRFLEVMAEVLGMKLEEIGDISLTSKDPCSISSTCTIFAESEMVSLRAEGRTREDLIAGIHKAVAQRTFVMARKINFRKEAIFTGGVAKNAGMVKAMEDVIGFKMMVPEEPQIIGALGAALFAAEVVKSGRGRASKN